MMKTTATLTTLAALAVAGAASACECSTKETKQLTAAPSAPAQMVFVGHEDGHDESKKKSKSMTFKIVETDGKARYWVNGKEVSKAGFEKAKKNSGASGASATANKKTSWVAKAAPKEPTPPTPAAAPKPRLGVVLGRVSDALAEKIHVDADEVILIERVIDGTPASKAGLKSHDVLVEFDGEDNLSVEKLRKLIAKQGSGGEVEVIVIRDGDEEEFEVVFHGGAPTAPEPPRAAEAPRARFFAGQLDEDKQEQVERAMRLAEQYSAQAQKQAKVWAHKIESEAKELEGLGKKLALRYDVQSNADFEAAMEELHESLAELDIDLNFEFNFDEADFPRMQFIELDDNSRNKAVILERRLHQEANRRAHQNERRLHERVERLHDSMREKQHNEMKERERGNADRHIEELEARISELEAMIDELSHQLERLRPRGVRN